MRFTSVIQTVIALAALIVSTGCNRDAAETPLPAGGGVAFEGSGVVLVPGDGWKELRSGRFTTAQDICLPVLEGDEQNKGVIQVLCSSSVRSDPQTRAAYIEKAMARHPEVVGESIKHEEFMTASGLKGVHVSYDLKIEIKGHSYLGRTHMYLVKNRKGGIVCVTYTTTAKADSEAVHEMIRKTLQLR